eukprot:GILI01017336.1.p1 GENE.GILI01017336.1~~GILI01017336.1.p1  ORF type:complete len:135 (-),score=22.24 GILI01017336.1:95-499(-)
MSAFRLPRARLFLFLSLAILGYVNAESSSALVEEAQTPGIPSPAEVIFNQRAANLIACMGCRFVWENVMQDLGPIRHKDTAEFAFKHYCGISPAIFRKPCREMSLELDDFLVIYEDGDSDLDALCVGMGMCQRK